MEKDWVRNRWAIDIVSLGQIESNSLVSCFSAFLFDAHGNPVIAAFNCSAGSTQEQVHQHQLPRPICKQRDAASQALVLWLESLKTWFFANQKGSLRTWIFFARLGTECHGAEVGMRLNQNGFASIKLPSYIQVTKCIQMLDVTRVQLWNSWNHSLFVSHCELCPLSWFRSQTPTTKSCRRLSRWESSSVRTEEA